MKNILALALLATIMITACTSLKRYSSVEQAGVDNTLADIDLFGFRLSDAGSAAGSKTLWDLSADAQSQYIKILNNRYPDNEKFIEAMSLGYLTPESPQTNDDYVKKDLRMIFSVSKRHDYVRKTSVAAPVLSSADRIEYLRISLRIPEGCGLSFSGWNMFTTQYGTINIADLTFSRSISIDGTGQVSTPGKSQLAEFSGGSSSSVSHREDQQLKYRYIMLNGMISKNGLEMEEEGTRETDLSGNISADISLEFDKCFSTITEITGTRDSTGRFNPPEKLAVRLSAISIPSIDEMKDTIFAELRMDYTFRNVLKGEKTFQEWDDHIRYYRGSVTKKIALLTREDFVPDLLCIGTGTEPAGRETIRLLSPGNRVCSMVFRNSRGAGNFYEWLDQYLRRSENREKTVTIGGYKLLLGEKDLTGALYLSHPDLNVNPIYSSEKIFADN
jgi:hypothetical protein